MEEFDSHSSTKNWIVPPFCVYFTALESKLLKICIRCTRSPFTHSCRMFSFVNWRVWFFSSACILNIWSISCIKSRIEKSVYLKTVFPASILLISKTSLIIPNKSCDDVSILSAYSVTFALSPASCLISDVIPMIAFIGVRISCDIFDRKSVFALFAFSAVCRASVAIFFAFFSFLFAASISFIVCNWSSLFLFSHSAFWSAILSFEIL